MDDLSFSESRLSDRQINFHMSEHGSLRNEILFYSKQCREALFYTFIGNASVIAWLASDGYNKKDISSLVVIGAWLPFFITIVGWAFYHYARRDMLRIAQYIMFLENMLTDTTRQLGWENYLKYRLRKTASEELRNEDKFLQSCGDIYFQKRMLRSNTLYNALFIILLMGACWTGIVITLHFIRVT